MMNTSVLTNSNSRRLMIIVGDDSLLEQMQAKFPSSSFQTVDLESRNSQIEHPTTSTHPKACKNKALICAVCDGPARGINFGVVTCEGCKLFFRRNAWKDQAKLICFKNNTCEIKYETRRLCIPCRLRKCFESGMKRDRLLNTQTKHPQMSATDSNQASTWQVARFFQSPADQNLLTSLDLERIETIRMAFANRIELAANGAGLQNPTSIIAKSYLEYVNTQTISALRLLVFYKQIPEFNQLNGDDKFTLSKYNLLTTIALYYTISFKSVIDNILLVDDDVPFDRSIFTLIYGNENYIRLQEVFRPIVQMGMYDNKIIHLALIVFILLKGLSTGRGVPEPILQDGMGVYRAQNFYIELLWKYLKTVYGLNEAVRILSNLVTGFLSWQIFYIDMKDNVSRNLSERDVDELSPLMKSLFHL